MLKVTNYTKMRKVLFFGSSTTWEVPSGVDYCTARICGGGGGVATRTATLPPARTQRSAAAMVHSAVLEGTRCGLVYMGYEATCRSGREFSGQSAFFGSVRDRRSFMGMIPAAVNEFGINLTPGETVTITVGAGGAQGALSAHAPGPGTANGGSGFVNIEYWI